MAFAASRIAIDDVHQFANRVLAIANDMRRIAAGGRHQTFADHQQTKIVARQITFDHHVVADFARRRIRREHRFAGVHIHRHAATLIAVARFEHHRATACGDDFPRHGPGFLGAAHRPTFRHRHAGSGEQLLGQFLVLRDVFGDGRGAVEFGGLDASLMHAPTELDQAAGSQPPVRNAARDGGIDDGAGRWPQTLVFVQRLQFGDGLCQIEWLLVARGSKQIAGQRDCPAADGFLAVFDDDLIHAGFDGFRGAAESHRTAGAALQGQRGLRQQRRQGIRHHGLRQTKTIERGKAHAQRLQQFVDECRRLLVGRALQRDLDGGLPSPQIGAAQRALSNDVHEGLPIQSGKKGQPGRRGHAVAKGVIRQFQRPGGGNGGE